MLQGRSGEIAGEQEGTPKPGKGLHFPEKGEVRKMKEVAELKHRAEKVAVPWRLIGPQEEGQTGQSRTALAGKLDISTACRIWGRKI